jgi:hypothetical protein
VQERRALWGQTMALLIQTKFSLHSIVYSYTPEVSLGLDLHSHPNIILLLQSACSRAVLLYHIHALDILLRCVYTMDQRQKATV